MEASRFRCDGDDAALTPTESKLVAGKSAAWIRALARSLEKRAAKLREYVDPLPSPPVIDPRLN
jgi:hypothetical protein